MNNWSQSHRQSVVATHPTRLGFTLLEVVLSLAVTSVLVVAVFGGIRLVLLTDRDTEIERTRERVVLGLTDHLRSQLRGVPSAPSDDAGTASSVGGTLEDELSDPEAIASTLLVAPDEETGSVGDFAFIGDINRVQFVHFAATDQAPSGEWVWTEWYLFGTEISEPAQLASADLTVPNPQGLIILDAPLNIIRLGEELGDYAGIGQYTNAIAPEVIGLTFQYWDGFVWLPTWDSRELGGPPLAVEMTLELASETGSLTGPALAPPVVIRIPNASADDLLDPSAETTTSEGSP